MPKKKCKINCKINTSQITDADLKIQSVNEENVKDLEVLSVMTIFRDAEDVHSHERLVTQLTLQFYSKLHIDDFCQDFFECMRYIMIYPDRLKSEIPFLFCVKFVIMCLKTESEVGDSVKSELLLKRFVKFITWYDNTNDTNIRFHSVQVTRLLLTEFTDDIPVPALLFEKIQALLLKRFWDVKSYVRAEAARASSRLQDPSDADCPIVVALMHLSQFDSSHNVRLAAMQSLAITTKTLPGIVSRSRDVNDLVRKKSFDLMTKWKILKPLTVSKRLQIIESGLTDKSISVQHSCNELLKMWLVASNDDPIAMLKRFDVENKEETTELAFTNLLKMVKSADIASLVGFLQRMMNEQHLVYEDQLCAETSFLWKHMVIFISDRADEYGDHLEKILPSVPDFELYLRRIFQKPIDQNIQKKISLDEYAEFCTIIKQLLPIVKYLDIFDPYNRKKIIDLIKWAMSSSDIPFNYVEHLMKILVHLEGNNVKICDETVELINELLFDNENVVLTCECAPTDIETVADIPQMVTEETNVDKTEVNKEAIRRKRIEIAKLDVEINELKEMITTSMQAKEFDGVQTLIYDLKNLEAKKSELTYLKEQLMPPVTVKLQETFQEPIEASPAVKVESYGLPLWMKVGMENRILKANIMTVSMIQECNLLWNMPSSLRSLFDNVILVSVRHIDPCVREKAILSLGLCCLLDKELAVNYYSIFLKSLEVDHDPIKEVAVRSLIDLFIRFGIEPFQESLISSKENSRILDQSSVGGMDESDIKRESFTSLTSEYSMALTEEEQNKCVAELLNPIIVLLNSDKTELKTTASIGLSKLLYHHKLLSPKLLSRLLLLWFNPETEDNAALRQHLGGFFSNYTLMSAENQESITKCFMITMRTLFKATASNPLSEVDITNVVDFFIRVTDSKYLLENRLGANKPDETGTIVEMSQMDNPCHSELAMTLSNQILKAPLSSEVKYYVAMLVRLRISSKNPAVINDIESIVTKVLKKLKDKKSLQLLEKFHKEVLVNLCNECSDSQPIVNNGSLSSTNESMVAKTPVSKPMLLEVNTAGKPQDGRFLSHTTVNIDSTIHDGMSSVDMNDTIMDLTMLEEDQQPVIAQDTTVASESKEISDDDIFKKPCNVRVTRSSLRQSGNGSTPRIANRVSTVIKKRKNKK